MVRLARARSAIGEREFILALGVLYVALAVGYPLIPLIETGAEIDRAMLLLVGGPGAILLYAGYRLPGSDVHPDVVPVVTAWCLGGIGAMLGLLGLTALAAGLTNPVENALILTAIGSVAGLAAGSYDARARTRSRTLERRNRELRQTKAELEETVDRLEASERRYRTLAKNFPNGAVAILDDDLRYTLLEGQGFEAIDLSADDLRGERVRDVHSDDALADLEPNFRAALEGEPSSFELRLQGRPFEFRTHPLPDDERQAVLAMSQDVSERKRRERELERRTRQQRAVAELGQFALETDDLDELMREASRRVADVLDVEYCKVLDLDEDREELLLRQGVGWTDGLVGEATVSAVEADSQAAYTLANDRPIVVEDLEAETRLDGPDLLTDHDVRSGISTVVGPFDEPWGILGVHDAERQEFSDEDVSFVQSVANVLAEAIDRHRTTAELEQLVADLEESNRRLEQFAYAASHDLQEPLRMVSSYLQLIERRYGEALDEEGEEFLEFAVDGADRMRSMIDGLLAYSRVETAADPLTPVDAGSVLEDARDDLRVAIGAADATITADDLPRVRADPNQLRQVFQNLLENAIEYAGEEPPTVRLSAGRNGDGWVLTIADDGIGIDAADQDRVFEVFERAHGRDVGDGTGIGLALCERIVERHGGEIWVESEPGEGTAVSFTLPAVDE